MRVLVTGAGGFIGSHLCRRLVAKGHEVVRLDDLSAGRPGNVSYIPELDLVEADLPDLDAVTKVANGCRAIPHQAARKSVPRSIRGREEITEVNVGGTLNVPLAARKERATVVFASSSSVDAGASPTPRHKPPREGGIRRSEADVSLARTILAHDPEVSIDEGVRRSVGWFAARG